MPMSREIPLQLPVLLWARMLWDLRKRGQGCRESGAFLLGRCGSRCQVVRAYIPYDDLDPNALATGIIVIRPAGFMKLWQKCKELGLEVLADIHTHPGVNTHLSESDRKNPLISQPGHIAFVLPHFARTWSWRLRGVGIYKYLGNYEWEDLQGDRREGRVRFRWRS